MLNACIYHDWPGTSSVQEQNNHRFVNKIIPGAKCPESLSQFYDHLENSETDCPEAMYNKGICWKQPGFNEVIHFTDWKEKVG